MNAVVSGLTEHVASGAWPEGTLLPPEDQLLAEFGVSRPTLREALQHMVAAGLVQARPRAGTFVLPRNNWNLLEPGVLEATLRHTTDRRFFDNLMTARMLIEPAAAAAAAVNGSSRQLSAIAEAFSAMETAEGRESESWISADLAFHTAIIEASDNWVFRQFISAMRAALLAGFQMTNRASQSKEGAISIHKAVHLAIQARDPERAKAAMCEVIRLAMNDMDIAIKDHSTAARPMPHEA